MFVWVWEWGLRGGIWGRMERGVGEVRGGLGNVDVDVDKVEFGIGNVADIPRQGILRAARPVFYSLLSFLLHYPSPS